MTRWPALLQRKRNIHFSISCSDPCESTPNLLNSQLVWWWVAQNSNVVLFCCWHFPHYPWHCIMEQQSLGIESTSPLIRYCFAKKADGQNGIRLLPFSANKPYKIHNSRQSSPSALFQFISIFGNMNICVNLNSRSQSKAQIWLLSPSLSDLQTGGVADDCIGD